MVNWKYKIAITFIISIIFFSNVTAQEFSPGKSYREKNSYVEYLFGDLPLVISVPHGGYEMPHTIPERHGKFAKNQDIYTIEIAERIYQYIYNLTGKYPHIVINHLHRTRLDVNRNILEAANGNIDAEKVWYEYQNCIDTVEKYIEQEYGKGLFIDLHGHRHAVERIELGYLLSSEEMQMGEELINSGLLNEYTSIRNLLKSNPQNLLFSELLYGEFSFGSMLNEQGQACIPSPENKIPEIGVPYFRGGYNTTRHGSSQGGVIDGIQIEMDLQTRSDQERQNEVAKDISIALVKYLSIHYFPEISDLNPE